MDERYVSPKDWLIIFMIICIPILNIAFLLYWAFGPETYKTNFAKAYLAFVTIMISIGVFFFVLNFENTNEDTGGNYYESLANLYETNEKVLVRDYAEDDLEIIDIILNHVEYGLFTTFIIKNHSHTNLHERIWIDLGFYDSNNILLDTYSLQLGKIPPGDTYKKEIFLTDIEIENVEETVLIKVLDIY